MDNRPDDYISGVFTNAHLTSNIGLWTPQEPAGHDDLYYHAESDFNRDLEHLQPLPPLSPVPLAYHALASPQAEPRHNNRDRPYRAREDTVTQLFNFGNPQLRDYRMLGGAAEAVIDSDFPVTGSVQGYAQTAPAGRGSVISASAHSAQTAHLPLPRCPTCGKPQKDSDTLRHHLESHDPVIKGRHKCDICGRGFRYPREVRRHRPTHFRTSEDEKFHCQEPGCKSVIERSDNFQRHLREHAKAALAEPNLVQVPTLGVSEHIPRARTHAHVMASAGPRPRGIPSTGSVFVSETRSPFSMRVGNMAFGDDSSATSFSLEGMSPDGCVDPSFLSLGAGSQRHPTSAVAVVKDNRATGSGNGFALAIDCPPGDVNTAQSLWTWS